MRAIFYVDGFNFYYLRTKRQPQYKWLNIKLLADIIVPEGTVVKAVNYYTAPVSGKIDSDAPKRQARLFAALRTVPEVNLYMGRHLYSEKWAGLVHPPRAKPDEYEWGDPPPAVVLVKRTEEKGSDVNLGAHLVRDAFTDAFDVAYVLTNDTDLLEPLRIVKDEVGKRVGIVAPCRPITRRGRRTIPVPAPSFAGVSDFTHYIDDTELEQAQFPDVIHRSGKRDIFKPANWV